jgi:hypothetical protein
MVLAAKTPGIAPSENLERRGRRKATGVGFGEGRARGPGGRGSPTAGLRCLGSALVEGGRGSLAPAEGVGAGARAFWSESFAFVSESRQPSQGGASVAPFRRHTPDPGHLRGLGSFSGTARLLLPKIVVVVLRISSIQLWRVQIPNARAAQNWRVRGAGALLT